MTIKQLDKIIDIFDRAVKVAERWADREYPQSDESQENDIGISHVGDQPLPQTPEEYREFQPEVSAFEKRLRNL